MPEIQRVVNWTLDQGTAVLTLNNLPMHVLSQKVKEELEQCLMEVEADDKVRVVILTAAGDKVFMAGGDITEFPLFMDSGKAWANSHFAHRVFNRLAALPKPTIAAINGLALGGGLELALCCDFRIAAEHAKFGLPEIKLGLFPGAGGTQRLTRLVGSARAKEIMFLGESFTAQEALALGLVYQVVPRGESLATSLQLAEKLKVLPGVALGMLKELIDKASDISLQEGLRMEKEYVDTVFQSEDVREGVEAFIQKRTPVFKHQ